MKRKNKKRRIKQTEKFPHPDYILKQGRYRGCRIRDLPEEYLEWMASTQDWGWAKGEIHRRRSEAEPNVDQEYRSFISNQEVYEDEL
jgi:hypothetical protein